MTPADGAAYRDGHIRPAMMPTQRPPSVSRLMTGKVEAGGSHETLSNDEGFDEFLRWAAERGVTDSPRAVSAPTAGRQDAVPVSAPASMQAPGGSCNAAGLGYTLSVGYFPDAGGRGLMASRNIEEGELILRVPKSALMSVLSAMEDSQLAKATRSQPRLSSYQILVVHLLREVSKRKLSPWYTYLVHLPRRHHSLANFSESAADVLQVEDAMWAAQSAVTKVTADWEGAKELMAAVELTKKCRSLNAWLWASATVSSRSLYVPWDSAGTLCPVGDLFNYAPPGDIFLGSESLHGDSFAASSTFGQSDVPAFNPRDDFSCAEVTLKERLRDGGFEPEHGEYCFYARRHYEAGEQVLLCYGQYTNLELLEHYGFCMTQNPNDVVHICPPNPESADLGGDPYVDVSGAPSFSLLARMRLQHAQPSMRKANRYTVLMGEQISVESDVMAYQWLLKQCELLLACLPSSLEDDLALAQMLGSAENYKSLETSYSSKFRESEGSALGYSSEGKTDGFRSTSEKVIGELRKLWSVVGDVSQPSSDTSDAHDILFEQWRLAVDWRLGYKRILDRCCKVCRRRITELLRNCSS